MLRVLGVAVLILGMGISAWAAPEQKDKALHIYFIDVEGGQATLFVTPAGQSLLIDTGWPGNDGRDADRIVAAAKKAGISKIDYVLITHFHDDHVGGVPQLAARFPVGTSSTTGTIARPLTPSPKKTGKPIRQCWRRENISESAPSRETCCR